MTPDEAIKRAESGDLLPVWLLSGEERLLRDQALAAITKAALAGGLAELNLDKFTAGETPVDKVLAATRTVPMMAKRRVVVVRGLERWDSSASEEGASEEVDIKALPPLDRLAEYAKTPIDTTCMILVAQKLDGRRKLVALAKKAGFLVDCAAVDGRRLPGWIKQRAEAKGHTIDADTCELIAEIAGPDLSYLDDVLERLSLYVGPDKPITEDAVSICVTRVKLADTWKLVDAASTKDLGKVLALFADVYDPRDRGLPLVGAIAWSLRQLLKLEAALRDGASIDDAARRAGIYPAFKARDLAKKLKAFRPRELERWLVVVQDTDVALKGSRRPPDAILEEMFVRLCRRAA
ncbi:MAG: DNA polymerase III subunit delta [Myxococcales bacterium 68-20]|nr:DNA polymerase III subunit delta [Myxococcales bacterium]OJY30282.1 MAG: DNA polymerase III subunit delta [Myxococcales bacterium 68-20]